ncbi:flavin reductase family protein [Nesterenkonia natronophila]|uniref:Flavin reductase family protein n=1 Tax=Nesterenkonia natronophila TaxID=2174932 RepID=A0A3A4F450_9MICC|nr:flavin reductase family protein [Nesterenkonia natronophila]RJN32638.1 flavin reductase family protein [Nesterenkonia natronophila]
MDTAHTYFYEPAAGHGLPHSPFNSIIAPRPIGWISSRDQDGQLNLAPYSFFNAFNYSPPIIGFASNGLKDSLSNAEATGEFCWNLADENLFEAMNTTSAGVSADVDEFTLADLTPAPSTIVSVPHVAEAKTVFECRTTQIVPLLTADGAKTVTHVVFGEVVGVHIHQSLLKDGIYQTSEARPMLRGGGPSTYFTIRGENIRDLPRPA